MPISITILAYITFSGMCYAASIIRNHSFEEADMSSWTITFPPGSGPWIRDSISPLDGTWYVSTSQQSTISQTIDPVLGSDIINFSFWIDRPTNSSILLEIVYGELNQSLGYYIDGSTGAGWGLFDARPYVEPSKRMTEFFIHKGGTGTARLDNFQLTVVPEPTTAVFLILGSTIILRRKRCTTSRAT